jgi:hypothetical protein
MDDIGMLDLEISKDLYDKMKYDFNMLENHRSSYNFFNFILDANHLIEWIEKDETVSKTELEKAKKIRKLSSYELLNDIANRSKHFIRRKQYRENPISKDEVIPGFSFAHFDYSKLNYGGPIFIIEQHGTEIDLYEECKVIFNFYKEIFE